MLQKTIKMLLLSTPVISAVLSTPANAWGQNGHRIVGEIASKHITDTTRQALIPLLDGESLPQIANFGKKSHLAGITSISKRVMLIPISTLMPNTIKTQCLTSLKGWNIQFQFYKTKKHHLQKNSLLYAF